MSDLPVAEATPTNGGSSVQVTAPSDLQEGYKLQVSVNGKDQEVTIPAGGVKEGQSFTAEIQEQPGGDKVHNIPTGQWRDGLCDCSSTVLVMPCVGWPVASTSSLPAKS